MGATASASSNDRWPTSVSSNFAFASKRAIVQAPPIATSGGRAKGLRREVTGMDARQALRPHGWGLQRVLPGAGP
ncbi:hypothetical protein CXG45_02130 [Pseudomonas plecoglossicida]|uniref:Uncharacterized protein n=1 Tax=Pseudomonas plecoglossicida TaxID=70775 RepID=A0ABX4UBW8_PSEDL|nr:hypothetical protein CXG44_14610 [Pseudomonas plecoglossicida]PLU95855.1 hypothetical protein CXG45_02130 [Pseudomonas plecoglossicida]PLV06830.1 hypothetical protein CXG48_01130 [Pseudomonas plecoglossicida]PLV17021.1 hypothetical protein CXG47_02450 [Pseudomonas plecoglossicida]